MIGKVSRKDVQQTVTEMNWHFGKGDVVGLVWEHPLGGRVRISTPITQNTRHDSTPYFFKCEVIGGKTYVTYRSRKRLVRKVQTSV